MNVAAFPSSGVVGTSSAVRCKADLRALLDRKYGGDVERVAAWYMKLAAVRRRKLETCHVVQRGACAICLRQTWMLPDKGFKGLQATLEHIVCQADGGTDHPHNLVLACYDCNNKRGTEDIWVFYERFTTTGRRRAVPGAPKKPKDRTGSDARREATIFGLALLIHVRPDLLSDLEDLVRFDAPCGDEGKRRVDQGPTLHERDLHHASES